MPKRFLKFSDRWMSVSYTHLDVYKRQGVGIVLIVFTAFVIFGGAKRISIITSIIVPIMAIAYILIALWTTIANIGELPAVFGTIFQSCLLYTSRWGSSSPVWLSACCKSSVSSST